ncbi:MAG: hypothetical protein ACKPKO_17535, partial [Candidatus Fonsibacter sp.]
LEEIDPVHQPFIRAWALTTLEGTTQTQAFNTSLPPAPFWSPTLPRSSNARNNYTRLAPSEASTYNYK